MASREAVDLTTVHGILKQNDIQSPKLGKVMADMRRLFIARAGTKLDWKQQYESACATLASSGGAKFTPSFQATQGAFASEQQELALLLRDPKLLLVPKRDFLALLEAIRSSGLVTRTEINRPIELALRGHRGKKSLATSVRPVMIEGALCIEPFTTDDEHKQIAERAKMIAAIRQPFSMGGMTKEQYAMFVLDGYRMQMPVDTETMTILDDEPPIKNDILYASAHVDEGMGSIPEQRHLSFGTLPGIAARTRARFRSTISGKEIAM